MWTFLLATVVVLVVAVVLGLGLTVWAETAFLRLRDRRAERAAATKPAVKKLAPRSS